MLAGGKHTYPNAASPRSREIRKYLCKDTDFSTRLRLGRNDAPFRQLLYKLEFEDDHNRTSTGF